MICSSCAHENRPSAKFCEECATPLARVCSSCGAELRPTAKFCDECATPVAASVPSGAAAPRTPGAAAAVPTAGTRKIVTIVFADLAGSTAMQERLDPESVRRFMERYYDAMRDAVESHGGTVTQFLGDGVKAVFGIPRVAEDDAIRAVRAGAAMQTSFRALAESQAGAVGTVGLRVAVNTGEVVANDDEEIIGDPVNVAARLQEQGGNGDVVVGGSTARLVAALVTLEPLGSFALKGRAEEVDAFRLESLDRPAGAATAAFVGREEELASIMSVYETAIDKPATVLAVLLGSPGLGKSRLIGEFIHRLGDGASVVETQCDEASLATFAPLADGLRERLGIDKGASAESVRTSIESVIPASNTERGRIATGIAALLAGSPASPEETFFVVRRFFAALASVQPVVLVIDDLQWAEPLLLDLVEHLVQWGSGVPLLVLVGARPELRDVRSSLVMPGGLVSEVVTLGGLDAGAAMRLAANVIGASDLPAVVAAKVLAASEGNPLFVGELVRMLVFEGALKREGERWTTGTALEALEMPPTIHALLAARIARLRPEERIVLERAAVVGRHFSRSAVAELLPADVADLDARLESLRRGEVIQRDTGWFLGEPVLRFHHVLIRDAAYRQLLKGTRAELHERFANWVEASAGDSTEHDETIGWHLEQAHQHLSELGPISAAGRVLGERASTRLAAEGRRTLARDDLSVASSLLGRAIARLDPDDPARADLALDWCEALLAAGDVGPAAGAIDELDRFVGDSERLRAWHTCFAGEHTVLTAPEGLPETADAVAEAADVMAAQGDAAGEAKAHFVHALVFRRLGKIGACEAALDRALAAARRVAGDRRRANTVLAIAPLAALWGPSPVTRASGRCLDVVRVLRITQGAPAVEAVALSCQGVLEALRGRTDAAHRMIASARKMVEELGITQRLLEADVFSAQVELLEGDAPAAERSLRVAYHGLRELGLGIDAARAAALLARALLAQDQVAEAEALSHESEVLAGDDLKAAIAWRGVRAEALARRGEHAAAVEFANQAVELASATDALLDHADARLALAAALRAAGRGREADAEERRAHELWEAKGATLLAERARSEGARGAVTPVVEAPSSEDRTARRRVRPNLASAALVRIRAAFDARDSAALHAIYHENSRCIDHPTGSTYGRDEGVAGMVALFRSDGAYYRGEPLATLGETLMLYRRWSGARGTGGGRYDVGEYESENLHVVEVDEFGFMVRMEIFAADHLGDAISCLYARYGEQLPEGLARARIATVAECMAIMLSAPNDLEHLAGLLAPDLECVDHRHLSLWSGRGAEAFLEQRRALTRVAENVSFTTQKIVAFEPDAMLTRVMHSGTERQGGGAYERPFLSICAFDSDGRLTRLEWFDDDREADALVRFDELTAARIPTPATRSRPQPNLGTATHDRMTRAFSTGDFDALRAILHPNCCVTDYPTGSSYGVDGAVASVERLFRSRDPFYEIETLATLGRSLVLGRRRLGSSGDTRGSYDVGAYESEALDVTEVDAEGRTTAIEIFAADQLGEAISRLYQRYAEQLPEGPERARAAMVAEVVSIFMLAAGDLDRVAAAIAPDFEGIDHRHLSSWSVRGAESYLEHRRALDEVAENVSFVHTEILDLHPRAVLWRVMHSGTDRESGGRYERPFLSLIATDDEGRVALAEWFDDDREAEALLRFDALVGGSAPTDRVKSRLRENAASIALKRMVAESSSRDFDALRERLGEDMEAIDHRWHASYGREGVVESCQRFMQPPDVVFCLDPIATLKEWLSLSRHSITAGGASAGRFDVGEHETEYLMILEVDRSERIQRLEFFAVDRLSDALVRLYERHAELLPEGPDRERAAATARSVAVWSGPIDPDRLATAISPDVANIDHRNLGTWSARGAEAFLRHWHEQLEITQGWAVRVDAVLAVADNAILDRRNYYGTGRDTGGAFENWVLGLWVFGADGLLDRIEVWEPDDEAAALARFDVVVGGADAREDPFANAASRANWRRTDCFNTRDWAGIEACISPDFVFDERRRLLRNTADRETWLAQTRLLFDVPDSRFTIELRATCGERLSLHLHRFEGTVAGGGGPLALDDHWALHEVDEVGRIVATVLFDFEDESAAYAELDARFERGESAEYPRAARQVAARTELTATRDWEAYAAEFAPGFVYRDYRRLGWGSEGHDGETLMRMQRSAFELAPDARYRWDHVRISERGVLRRLTLVGTRDGGAFENPMLSVHEADDQGRSLRLDSFDINDLDRALARFAELSSPAPAQSRSSQSPFENTAARAVAPIAAAWEAQDWNQVAGVLPAHFRASDRRRAVQLELDRDEWVAFIRSTGDMQSTHLRSELLATRGDRLMLSQLWIELAGDDVGLSENTHLSLFEVDEHGTPIATVRWDEDDLAAAYAELDARFLAGEGAVYPHVKRAHRALGDAWRNGDWDALAACCAPGFTYNDHRLLGFGEILDDAEKFAHSQRVLVELAPDSVTRMDHVRFSNRGALRQLTQLGTRDGGAFETSFLSVMSVDPQGAIERMDLYDLDRYDDARAHFDGLTAPVPPSAHPFANAATRDFDQQIQYFLDRDWSGFADWLPVGFRYIDRRRMTQLELDADQFIAFIQPLGEMASTRLVAEPLATRGDRLALVRMRFEGAGGDVGPSEIDDVSVIEADETGRCIVRIRFDGDDLDAAYAELEERWQAALGPEHPMGFLRNFTAALVRRDWDAVVACYAPEFVGDDHRLVGWGTLQGPSAFIRTLQEMVALAPDAVMRMNHVRASGSVSIHDATWSGTRDGGAFESPFVVVNVIDAAAKVVRADFYDFHHLDRALARFGELADAASPSRSSDLARPNGASEWLHRLRPIFDRRDWDAMRDLFAEEFVYEDRQRYSRVSGGLEMVTSSIRERADAGALLERFELLGTAGTRVAVQRTLWAGGGSENRFEIEFLVVQEVDEAGRLTANINFDPDDTRAAQREMWARWAAIEPHVAAFTTPFEELCTELEEPDS